MSRPSVDSSLSSHSVEKQAGYDVVAIGASAGGVAALQNVLYALPANFGAAIVVLLHTAQSNRSLVDTLTRRSALHVSWAEENTHIQPGHVYVCPAYRCVEVNPDGSFTLTSSARGAKDYPINALFVSVADSYQKRSMGVILTGMLHDGTEGVRAIKQAGGTILVQSEETAEYPSMPRAAIETGAVDLVLSLNEIGPMLADLVTGYPLPLPRSEREAIRRLFVGESEVPRLLREMDWTHMPLGPVTDWPACLQTAVRLALESPIPVCILWGEDQIQLYNDHYRLLMGSKHPAGLGQPNRLCWPEVWHLNEPLFQQVFQGIPVALEDALYPILRHGGLEDAWFNLYYTPVRNDRNEVAGILATITETTDKVLAARRMAALHTVSEATSGVWSVRGALQRALEGLRQHSEDVPFAIGYLFDASRMRAQLAGAVGTEAGSPLAPYTLGLDTTWEWPLAEVLQQSSSMLLEDLPQRFRGVLTGPQRLPPKAALLLPLRDADPQAMGLLILGINPRLPLDTAYQQFLELLGEKVRAALVEAVSRQRARERMERLAELDRLKTEFFQNISHEFRTPLTLMLAPLEEALQKREQMPAPLAQELEVISRNARRLRMLVESLLDFSQVQAKRLYAHFEPVDLAELTTDLASLFRSAIERAGLRFTVDCEPLSQPAWVDVAMWEKIVSNLLANALKFTFTGEIALRLRTLPKHIELQVRDTGAGIPEEELPHIFKRFHRVRGIAARTQEGAGIGLALVQELVKLHSGRIRVKSEVGAGTTFTLWMPLGNRRILSPLALHLEAEEEETTQEEAPPRMAAVMAEQAMGWVADLSKSLSEETMPSSSEKRLARTPRPGARLLVVDDNADMRAYLARLLSPYWQVETAGNGAKALESLCQNPPDLLLADVMMPGLDGFELLKRVRAEDKLSAIPVLLVTARAGEEAAIEGLLAGADDYIAKPFSAQELIVRVGAQLELARVRRESEAKYRALVNATSESVYRMSADWSEMRQLDGRGFIADTPIPTVSWLEKYILPKDQPRVLAAIQEAIRTRSPFQLEHRILRADGTTGWTLSRAVPLLDEKGEIVEWFGAASNITTRKQAEEELHESEQRF